MIIATIILIILNIVLYINTYLLQSRIDDKLTAYTPTTAKRRQNVYLQIRKIKTITSDDSVDNFVFSFDDSRNIPETFSYFQYKSATFKITGRTSHSVTGELLIGASDSVQDNTKSAATFLFFA